MIRNILVISLVIGSMQLIAQGQQDSSLVEEISIIKNNILEQQKEIDVLNKTISNQWIVIGRQKKNISALQEENKSLFTSTDSLSLLIQTNGDNTM